MINIKFEHDADRASAFDGKVKIGECVFVELYISHLLPPKDECCS